MLKALIAATFVSLAGTAPTDLDFSGINKFALKLLDNTYAFQENFGNKNIAISPLSVWSVFSLLAEGSAGDTFQELMTELRLPTDLRSTQAMHMALKNILKSNNPDVTLKGQTAMFSDCSLDIHPEFCQSALSYNTDVYIVNATDTTKLAKDINYYICLATDGRITNAVQPSLLDDLRMILIDALYFKASWTYPFDPTQTKEESFYNSQGKTIGSVNMMYHKAPHSLGDSVQIGAQILEMTYGKDERFSMLILLPFDGMPLKKLLNNLANQNLDWMSEFKIGGNLPQIDCYIPRFKISSQTDLIPPLQYTGIHSIFDIKSAQLPGVSDSPLYVSKTIQNVEIEVTEEGTVAAAATVVGLEDRILGQRFEANKEFVFLILDRKTNVILFEGIYSDPAIV
ncbi:serine protease inhibitor 77Ba-like [Pectinophora gossypiella]|uniref:serine protease inhibitor 77Ba-like n=1 Tax=Pectinophora gossypiella TaxID=13191 RepID=UPI00214EEBD5|nr:serine protease inhibitor 77Ba-like [Pectinophora gossypiella]